MSFERSNGKPRTVKLWCASASKMVSLVVWEEDRLDLGYIGRVFGLDPSTVKLNSHLISRGVDLVSCCVTWRSLLNFFSTKGLSTGRDDNDPLVVDGKFCKVGTKRAHDLQDAVSMIHNRAEPEDIVVSRRPQPEDYNLLVNKRLKESNSECKEDHKFSKWTGLSFKRKQFLEDLSLLKKLRINEANLGHFPDFRGRESHHTSIVSSRPFTCSYMSGNVKRMREDEVTLAAPSERII